MDESLNLENINKIDDFDILKNICEKNNFFQYINKFAIESLNLKKIKNFLIACVEEKNVSIKLTSFPYKLIVDPTNACNLGCPLCPTGLGASDRKKGILKFSDFKKIVDESKDYCIEMHLYNWGEPTLNKELVKMIKYAHENKIWTRISSNMSLNYKENYLQDLVTSGLSLLHIDIDGLDQEVYVKYRKKGNLNTVLNNLKEIIKIKETRKLEKPVLELAMLAMRQNEHQHDEFLKLKDKFNVDVVKIDKIQHNPNMDEKWLPKNKDLIYKTYEGGSASSNSAKDNEIKQCHWPWSSMVINHDGGVNPCCIIDDPNSDFSNLKSHSISEVWNNEEYISSRSEFGDKSQITKPTICNVCKNQTHSKRLNRVSKSFSIKL
jgi:radical SAM protein with 4Fe4S-binding SPASM domain